MTDKIMYMTSDEAAGSLKNGITIIADAREEVVEAYQRLGEFFAERYDANVDLVNFDTVSPERLEYIQVYGEGIGTKIVTEFPEYDEFEDDIKIVGGFKSLRNTIEDLVTALMWIEQGATSKDPEFPIQIVEG